MSFNFGAGNKARVKEAFRFQFTLCFGYYHLLVLAGDDAGARRWWPVSSPPMPPSSSTPPGPCASTWPVSLPWAFQIACQQSFMALGQAKVSLLLACLRKLILLIPLIFLLPHLLPDPVFGVSSSRSPSATSLAASHHGVHVLCPGSIKFSIGARRTSERISGTKKSIAVFDSDGFFVCGFYALVFSSSATRSGASA